MERGWKVFIGASVAALIVLACLLILTAILFGPVIYQIWIFQRGG